MWSRVSVSLAHWYDEPPNLQVPLWAEYRLAVELQAVANAVVTDASGGVQQVAVHIFGVDQGTCPPGTYLKPRPGYASCGSCRQACLLVRTLVTFRFQAL